jgi:putative hydrolase of the HAD superfamily
MRRPYDRNREAVMHRYRAVLFDLFGTLVLFKPKVPTLTVAGTTWRSTMHWLREQAQGELPDIRFEDFVAAISAVTEEIVRARPPEYHEVLSQERFRRAVERVGITGEVGADTGRRLSLRHMDHLASNTEVPAAHGALLRAVATRYATGLVSNFDHAPTARRLLVEHAIDPLLRVSIISAEFGRRKPHPSIFHAALDAVDAAPGEALYVGDSLGDDVCGAQAAGMDVVWINASGEREPSGSKAPTYTVTRLEDIASLLGVTAEGC